MDVEELIQKITEDAKMRAEKAARAAKEIERIMADRKLQSLVYRDEPILKTAAQMENYLPAAYRGMRALARTSEAYQHSTAWLFYQQGKLLEEHTDDFIFNGEFQRYFPTYQGMNDYQLRGYFSWRTALRRGEVRETEASFVFVYVYELLHCIGVDSPEAGFYRLRDFWQGYREFLPFLDRYLQNWMRDFVVYYGLDSALLDMLPDTAFDKALMIVLEHRIHDEQTLFEALCTLSSYPLKNSAFYKQYPDDVRHVVCAVLDAIAVHHETRCKNTFCERLFGRKTACPYTMFASAVFYDRKNYTDYSYSINLIHTYSCHGGNWLCEKYYGNRGKNKELGHILKTVDRLMRKAYAFPQPLRDEDCTKLLAGIVTKAIGAFLEKKNAAEARKVEIDLSKLQGIRTAAAETREKLLIEEDDEDTKPMFSPPKEVSEATFFNDLGLSEAEYRFMQCLLYSGDCMTALKENHLILSMAVDSINEKLLDRLGDTAIDFDGETPLVIEDYISELKGWVHQ